MLKFFNANQRNYLQKLETILRKRKLTQKDQSSSIKKILSNVKKYGDKAVIRYEKKFSKIKTKSKKIKFSNDEINKILRNLDTNLKKSIDTAFNELNYFIQNKNFPLLSLKTSLKMNFPTIIHLLKMLVCMCLAVLQVIRALSLMNCIPAIVAGVKNIYLTTPALGSS